MSTRCQVAFDKTEVTVYQHSDGYPEGMLPDLLPFVAEFMAGRGYDECYMPARLVQHLANCSDKAMEEFRERVPLMSGNKSARDFLGFGISTALHGDIDYLYRVRSSGAVEVCRMSYEGRGKPKPEVLVTIELGTPVKDALRQVEAA